MRTLRLTHFGWHPSGPAYAPAAGRGEDSNGGMENLTVESGTGLVLRMQLQNLSTDADHVDFAPALQYRLRFPGAGDFGGWSWVSSDGATPTSPNYPVRFLGNSGTNVAITARSLSVPTLSNTGQWVNGLHLKQAGYANTVTLDNHEYTELACWLAVPDFPIPTEAWEFRVVDAGKQVNEHAWHPALFQLHTLLAPPVGEMDVAFYQAQGERTPLAKLEAYQTNSWRDISPRLYCDRAHPITLSRRLKSPTTADLWLDNHDGLLARGNAASQYNSGETLLDPDRRVRLSQGWRLYYNTERLYQHTAVYSPDPGATHADAAGTALLDFTLAQPTQADVGWVGWLDTDFVVTVSYAGLADWKGAAIRMLSKTSADVAIPTSAVVIVTDSAGTTYTYLLDSAHLGSDERGQAQVLCTRDAYLDYARNFEFRFAKVASCWALADEIGIYCGSSTDGTAVKGDWYRQTFAGLLGDSIAQEGDDRGLIHLAQVRDSTKRLADNFQQTFAHYKHSSNTPNTVEQIIADLLSSASYGVTAPYSGYSLEPTGFVFPKWTQQNCTILDACAELAKSVGFVFSADDEGTWRLWEPDWTRCSGQRHFVSGMNLAAWEHDASDRNMRNDIIVSAEGASNSKIKAEAKNQASIDAYGARRFYVTEPSLKTSYLCRRLAKSILRDYGWVQRIGQATVKGDLTLRPGMVAAVVDSWATYSQADELYRVDAQETRQTGHLAGDIEETLGLRGYNPRLPSAPDSLTAQAQSGGAVLNWVEDLDDPTIAGYNVYQAGSLGDAFAQVMTGTAPPQTVVDLTNDVPYWFEVQAYMADGVGGDKAGPVVCTPCSGTAPGPSQGELYWVPTSVSATSFAFVSAATRPEVRFYGAHAIALHDDSHMIFRATNSAGPWHEIGSVEYRSTAAVQRFVDMYMAPTSDTYYYHVRYYRGTDDYWSAPSSIVSVVVT